MGDAALVVCPLCVQWRCAACKSDDWPGCCDADEGAEPYWPDGSTATLTQKDWCARCAQAVADYQADVRLDADQNNAASAGEQ